MNFSETAEDMHAQAAALDEREALAHTADDEDPELDGEFNPSDDDLARMEMEDRHLDSFMESHLSGESWAME